MLNSSNKFQTVNDLLLYMIDEDEDIMEAPPVEEESFEDDEGHSDPEPEKEIMISGSKPTYIIHQDDRTITVRLDDGRSSTIHKSDEFASLLELPSDIFVSVPDTITRAQAKIIIDEAGLTGRVDSLISQMPDSVKTAWADSPYISRNSELLISLSNQLGLAPEFVDELFIKASKLKF